MRAKDLPRSAPADAFADHIPAVSWLAAGGNGAYFFPKAMPTYIYETVPAKKGARVKRYEIRQSIKDAALTQHPETQEPIRRVLADSVSVITSSSSSGGGQPHRHTHSCGCGAGGCGR
jgi:predicted nucleic acid-binding Zn ribbon protein